MAEHAADEHGRRSDHIITAVLRRGAQGGRTDASAQSAAEQRHPQLHKNGSAEDGKAQSRKRHRLGMQNFFKGRARQLRADEQNQHGDEQAGKVFHARMAERMLLIRRPLRQAEAQQRHERGSGVREIVQAVRRDGHRAGQRARQQLARRQQHIAHDADDPGQLSVAGAHGGILRVPVVLDKQAQQQLRQIHRSPFRPCRYLFIIRNFVEKVYLFLQEPCNSSDL